MGKEWQERKGEGEQEWKREMRGRRRSIKEKEGEKGGIGDV